MSRTTRRHWAHPRMRGEHGARPLYLELALGSSPHARGARRLHREVEHFPRLIPACAGSTPRARAACPSPRAHPRMRGEHLRVRGVLAHCEGSSPHARGAPTRRSPWPPRTGLIPACAGSTDHGRGVRRAWQAHPRMRGEHHVGFLFNSAGGGSSPHARGAPALADLDLRRVRLIPACAGSTTPRTTRRRSDSAHPRMRGEHRRPSPVIRTPRGSSPHARGAPHTGWPRGAFTGLIPACAGSTDAPTAVRSSSAAHPRMRGEHRSLPPDSDAICGSSPHARGAPVKLRLGREDQGLIPACAGSTGNAART